MSKEREKRGKELREKHAKIGPQALIKKLLSSDSPQDLKALLSYLHSFNESMQKVFAYDFELREFAIKTIITKIKEDSRSKSNKNLRSAEKNNEDLTDSEIEKIYEDIADFFHVCYGK
jgi:predicted acetyltransferase